MINFTQYACPVISMSLAEIKHSYRENHAEAISSFFLATGGFMTSLWTKEMEEAQLAAGYREEVAIPYGPIIYYLKDIADQLHPDEVEALIRHEEGHVVLGHLDVPGIEQAIAENCSIDDKKFTKEATQKSLESFVDQVNLKNELEADAWAASFTSARAMKQALPNTIKAMLRTARCDEENIVKVVKEALTEPIIAARLAALS